MFDKRIIGLTCLIALPGTVPAVANDATDRNGSASPLTFSGESVEFALEKIGGHSLVNVDVGDGSRHHFIIDTGAAINVVDQKLAIEHGFEVVGETPVGAPGGNQVPGKVVRIPQVRVGGAVVRDAEFVVIALDQMTGGLMQGILGMELFRDYLLTIDQGPGRVVVSRGSLSPGEEAVIAYDGSHKQIQIELDVAGQRVSAHIDTGAPGDFTLPIESRDTLPLRAAPVSTGTAELVGGTRRIERATLSGAIEFAGLRYESPAVAFMTPSSGHGNIGNGILDELEIVLDQRNSLISFRRSTSRADLRLPDGGPRVVTQFVPAADSERRRLGIRFAGVPASGGWLAAGVDHGSIGERAGFRAGDVILSINGRPSAEFDIASLGSLLGSATPLEFVIERNGNTQTLKVP